MSVGTFQISECLGFAHVWTLLIHIDWYINWKFSKIQFPSIITPWPRGRRGIVFSAIICLSVCSAFDSFSSILSLIVHCCRSAQ